MMMIMMMLLVPPLVAIYVQPPHAQLPRASEIGTVASSMYILFTTFHFEIPPFREYEYHTLSPPAATKAHHSLYTEKLSRPVGMV